MSWNSLRSKPEFFYGAMTLICAGLVLTASGTARAIAVAALAITIVAYVWQRLRTRGNPATTVDLENGS
jgi:hypothetical protein